MTEFHHTPGTAYLRGGGLTLRDESDVDRVVITYDGVFVPGEIFVDAENGSNANSGATSATAKATITAAITAASAGDTILILPGTYEENVVVNKDYLRLVGAYEGGYARPDIAPTTGVGIKVSAQGVVLKHLRAVSANDDVCQVTGNGYVIKDCVFDGDTNGATKAGIRLWCDAADDSYTASEGKIVDSLVRNSEGYGIAFDVQNATVGVGPTHVEVEDVRFIDNTGEDVIALATAAGTYSIQDSQFRSCSFMSKNKATHVDISTNNGATNTGNVFEGCFFFDDTINTTAIKAGGTGSGFIGCFSLDGVIDGDALD